MAVSAASAVGAVPKTSGPRPETDRRAGTSAPTPSAVSAGYVCTARTRAAVEQLFRDGNRDALVGELASKVSRTEAEDLVMRSVERALSGRCRAEHIAGVHKWIRQDARFALSHLLEHKKMAAEKLAREAHDPARPQAFAPPDDRIVREDSASLVRRLLEEAELSPIEQDAVRLYWAEQLPRKDVAGRLGMPEGTLKKRLARVGRTFEAVLVTRCGGGCGTTGEEHVRAYAFQHRTAGGDVQALATAHMDACERCSRLFWRLEQVRLAVAGLAPAPIGHQALRHGLWARGLESLAGLGRALRDGGEHAKAQTISAYARALDVTPLAGMRTGAGAALLGTCVAAVGGGAYCVSAGVDPTAVLLGGHSAVHARRVAERRPMLVAKTPAAPTTGTHQLHTTPAPAVGHAAAASTAQQGTRAARRQRASTPSAPQREFEPTSVGGSSGSATTAVAYASSPMPPEPLASASRGPAPAQARGGEFGGP